MKRATVHVDLANRSCYVSTNDTLHGAWAPGITRRTAETAIAADGWKFAPGSEWAMTIDGGTREVEQNAITADDALLNSLGSAMPGTSANLLDDELSTLLLAWRREVEADPIEPLGRTA